jgi:hypothetical protein
MNSQVDLHGIHARIGSMQQTALELKAMGEDVPCLVRNVERILASLKMLEIDFCDVVDLEEGLTIDY